MATDTQARLLEIARDVYLEVGPAQFSLREVARRADLSAAAVYRHFDDKDALLAAVCAEGFRIFASYLMQSLAEVDPRKRLRAAGERYLRFALENPRDYRVIFMNDAETVHLGKPERRAQSPTFRFLVDRVGECMRAKVFRRGDAEEIAITIWAYVHGFASLRLSGQFAALGDDAAFEAFYARAIDRMIDGLG
jgi:AcrR family transcriptional regulator